MSASDQPIVMLLERIAIALESIAGKKQQAEKNCGVMPPVQQRPGTDEYARCRAWAKANGAPGVRAQKVIARAGITSFDEVTRERLVDVKNCGEITIKLLLEWAASKST